MVELRAAGRGRAVGWLNRTLGLGQGPGSGPTSQEGSRLASGGGSVRLFSKKFGHIEAVIFVTSDFHISIVSNDHLVCG